MLARARTFTIEGLRARAVTVEVDIRPGLPTFTIVGLASAAVREARDRVHAAVLNCGFEFPMRRITVNLAPADVPKAGPGLDLALACAVLAASGQLDATRLERCVLFGELSLDGEVRSSDGTLAVAEATMKAGMETLLVGPARAREALLVEGLNVSVVERLNSAARVLGGGEPDPLPGEHTAQAGAQARTGAQPRVGRADLAEVRGQDQAVRATIVAAAGAHNALLCGSPGTGKTMLAQRLPSILPPLSRAEAIEVTRIHSVTGMLVADELVSERPFRAPHHSITAAGLVGGARSGSLGEVVLAHNGVLFLDELSEFGRTPLEALRQPLEEGRVAIARARHCAVYPARFMLLAATNPCPCGYAGQRERCRCRESDLARHRRRLSGPLLDRLDVTIAMEQPSGRGLAAPPASSSDRARELVTLARERQARRLRGEGILVNAHMDAGMLGRHAALDDGGHDMLMRAIARGMLSNRGAHRLVRLARTLADLEGSARVREKDVAGAISLRTDATLSPRRAA